MERPAWASEELHEAMTFAHQVGERQQQEQSMTVTYHVTNHLRYARKPGMEQHHRQQPEQLQQTQDVEALEYAQRHSGSDDTQSVPSGDDETGNFTTPLRRVRRKLKRQESFMEPTPTPTPTKKKANVNRFDLSQIRF